MFDHFLEDTDKDRAEKILYTLSVIQRLLLNIYHTSFVSGTVVGKRLVERMQKTVLLLHLTLHKIPCIRTLTLGVYSPYA